MSIDLFFVHSISEAYKQKLQTFVDDVLAQGLTENLPPCITFPGMNRATTTGINILRRDYDLRDYDHA